MKRILYKIENWIAIRFLRRELSQKYAGLVLHIAYEVILKKLVEKNSNTGVMTYTYDYKEKTYQVKSVISISELKKEE